MSIVSGSEIGRGFLRSLQSSLHTSFFEDGGLRCSYLLSLNTSVRPGGHPFGPKAGCMTFEVSCVSLYGSPGPAPLSDPAIDLTCPFDPLIDRICPSKLRIVFGNCLRGQLREAGGIVRIGAV